MRSSEYNFNKMKLKQNKNITLLIVLLGLIALIFRVWGIDYALPFLYSIDEGQIIPSAVRFGTGDLNPHTFTYPPFFKYLLFAFYGIYYIIGSVFGVFSSVKDFEIMYFNDPSPFYLIGRLTSAVMGVITVIITYFIGKNAYNKATGLLASLFLAFCWFHIEYSRLALPDGPMSFFIILSLYFSLKIIDNDKLINYVAAGIFCGFAIATKYHGGIAIFAILAAHLIRLSDQNQLSFKSVNVKPLIVGYFCIAGAFLLANPYAVLDFQSFWRDLQFDASVVPFEGNIFIGLFKYLKALFFNSSNVIDSVFGAFIVGGFGYAIYRRSKADLLLLLFPSMLLLYISYKTANLIKLRYLLPIYPLFYLFGARFIVDLMKKLPFHEKAKYAISFVLIFVLMINPVKTAIEVGYRTSQKDTATLAREWVEENIPADSKILYTDFRGLMLKENRESLIHQYEDAQKISANYSSFSFEFPQNKLDALTRYDRPAYYIAILPQEWGGLTNEKAEELEELPPGIGPVDFDKISIDYWMDQAIEYAIVFDNHQLRKYFTEEGQKMYPKYFLFFSELFEKGDLVKEFIPGYDHSSGAQIKLYKFPQR